MKPIFDLDRNIDSLIEPLVETLTRHRALTVLIAVLGTGVATWLDRASGHELSLAALYLGPVALVAWFLGKNVGRAWCVIVSAAGVLAEVTTPGSITDYSIVAWNTAATLMLSIVVVEMFTRLRHALEVERDLARTDALTGVANTRSFKELAAIELERANRYGRTFTLAVLDLDHFKNVNDTLGHAAGDRLLRDVGQAIRRRLRRVDIVARMGGDEFVVLLPETNESAAAVALDHVREALQALTDEYGPEVRASFGAVTFASPPNTIEEMLKLADVALYQAKSAGRDRIEWTTVPLQVQPAEA